MQETFDIKTSVLDILDAMSVELEYIIMHSPDILPKDRTLEQMEAYIDGLRNLSFALDDTRKAKKHLEEINTKGGGGSDGN